jgi:hypothetical protein
MLLLPRSQSKLVLGVRATLTLDKEQQKDTMTLRCCHPGAPLEDFNFQTLATFHEVLLLLKASCHPS